MSNSTKWHKHKDGYWHKRSGEARLELQPFTYQSTRYGETYKDRAEQHAIDNLIKAGIIRPTEREKGKSMLKSEAGGKGRRGRDGL